MKKLFFILLASALFAGYTSQSYSQAKNNKDEYVMMKDGKMMVIEGGMTKPMTEDMIMDDGTKVTTLGILVMTDGTTRNLMEGEKVYKIENVKTKIRPQKNKMN